MKLQSKTPKKALNKAFLKLKPSRLEIDSFKENINKLLNRSNDIESEEFHKNLISDFLKETYYKSHYFINTKGRNDLVIHLGNTAETNVGTIIEAKKPTNKYEMITKENLNVKAFHELILYFLRERITNKNLDIKHLIATNNYEWFIFDAKQFEQIFAQNKKFVKQFKEFENGQLSGTSTDFFYTEIASKYISEIETQIEASYFDIREYQKLFNGEAKKEDVKLIALYKIFSPEHLLKLPFANDSNSLNKAFYNELLHIIGLVEVKDNGKKLIKRNKEGQRHSAAILENTIIPNVQLNHLKKGIH